MNKSFVYSIALMMLFLSVSFIYATTIISDNGITTGILKTGDMDINGDVFINGTLRGHSPLKIGDAIQYVDKYDSPMHSIYTGGFATEGNNVSSYYNGVIIHQADHTTNPFGLEECWWDKEDQKMRMCLDKNSIEMWNDLLVHKDITIDGTLRVNNLIINTSANCQCSSNVTNNFNQTQFTTINNTTSINTNWLSNFYNSNSFGNGTGTQTGLWVCTEYNDGYIISGFGTDLVNGVYAWNGSYENSQKVYVNNQNITLKFNGVNWILTGSSIYYENRATSPDSSTWSSPILPDTSYCHIFWLGDIICSSGEGNSPYGIVIADNNCINKCQLQLNDGKIIGCT